MQTSVPKIATVILAITAVCFMGMAVASYYGRPDPIAEMHAPEIDEFAFEATQTETGITWTVTPGVTKDKTGLTDTTPKQKDNAYAAILEAHSSKTARLTSETNYLNDLTTKLRDRITQVESEQTQDLAALQAQADILATALANDQLALDSGSVQFQKLAVDTRTLRDETTKRREDVVRLQSDLAELRTDRFRLTQQRLILTDRLLRLQLENEAIQRRLDQLMTQTQ